MEIINIIPDGDLVLAVNDKYNLRVSSLVLTLTSSVFKALIEAHKAHPSATPTLSLGNDEGDGMYILCSILHLRNDKLPTSIEPDLLIKVAKLANKYQCVVAAGRATLQWFDRLYASKGPWDVWKIIEAAYLLDEAMFFARFTNRWMLQQPLSRMSIPVATESGTEKLAAALVVRHTSTYAILRDDLDGLVETCAHVMSKQAKHYIDYAPGLSPDADETPTGQPPTECRVDGDGAKEYLGALRDAQVWPITSCNRMGGGAGGSTIGDVLSKLKGFREPDYDDTDKCEFCEGIKINFTECLDITRDAQADRLWGLCLDCYKAGGINAGECRFEHAKVQQQQQQQTQAGGGLGIAGL